MDSGENVKISADALSEINALYSNYTNTVNDLLKNYSKNNSGLLSDDIKLGEKITNNYEQSYSNLEKQFAMTEAKLHTKFS